MNKREGFDHARIDEREWQAQERALQDVRTGTPSTDPLAARYRAVAEALRAPLPELLPPDFAARMAAQVRHAPLDARFEGTLVRTLTTLLGLSGAASAALYGRQWLPAILGPLQLDSASALNWTLALGACVAITWLAEPLRRMAMR
jgi:hypothetical protein